MKSIYVKAGKTEDVFNDLKDNFNGTLVVKSNEYNLAVQSDFARGNIKGISFPDGMTYFEFNMFFYENARLSMELFSRLPIFFMYCSEGTLQHSFGEQGEKKRLKEHHRGILKSTKGVNSILYFEREVPIKFSVIGMVTKPIAKGETTELIKKLKNTFFKTTEDYLESSAQNFKITDKIMEFNTVPQQGMVGNVLKNGILENILAMEIEQHTDGFTKMSQALNSIIAKRLDEIKSATTFIINLPVEFMTKILPHKTRLLINKSAVRI